MAKPKLVFFVSRFPFPLEKGDKLRAYHQLKSLYLHFDICLLAISHTAIVNADLQQIQPFCTSIHVLQLSKWKGLWNAFVGFFNNQPLQVNYFYSKKIEKKIQEIVNKENPICIYTQLARLGKYNFTSTAKQVMDLQDAFSVNYFRSAKHTSFIKKYIYLLEANRMQIWEKLMCSKFKHLTIISEPDKISIGAENLTVIKNGVDTQYFSLPKNNAPEFDILFIGNLGYLPNQLAANMLALEIAPLILKKMPRCKILIAGANANSQIRSLATNNIQIQSWVPDIRDAYKNAKIFIAPLFSGAGLQNKLLEAMAMQLPCITTDVCNASLGAQNGLQIIIANTAIEFANTAYQLLENVELANNQSQQGFQFVNANYSWQQSNTQLLNLLMKGS